MGSILLETARDRSTQYNIFNSLQMIGKKEAYIQIKKKNKFKTDVRKYCVP